MKMMFSLKNGHMFTLTELMESLVEWVVFEDQFPEEIYLKPESFIKFCQYTDQFVKKPSFIGIPVKLHYKRLESNNKSVK